MPCDRCRHWQRLDHPTNRGECRINPPTCPHITTQDVRDGERPGGLWPVTCPRDWCSEFERSEFGPR